MMQPGFAKIFLAAILGTFPIHAQAPAEPRVEFEVASIKPNKSGVPAVWTNPFAFSPGGRFTETNVTLVDVIVMAYGARRARLQGGPKWIDSDRFDIAAKADNSGGSPKQRQMIDMIRGMLEDRFKLALHTETKEISVYALVLAGKNPPKLEEAKEGEQASNAFTQGRMIFRRWPIGDGLTNVLANILRTPVVDRTGIKGLFNFTLSPAPPAGSGSATAPPYNFGDAMVAALPELGFKLERQKAPQEITIIDHAEAPTEN